MIEPEAIEHAWQGPWQKLPRSYRRFYVAMAAVIGGFFWMFVPFQVIGLLLVEDGRRELLGYLAYCFGAGLPIVAVAVVLHRMWAPEHAAQDALKREGVRVAGQLLRKRYAPTGRPSIPLVSYYLFGAEVPGGPPVFARLTARNGIPVGCPATIAYDPARPGEGVVVETVGALKRAARP